MAPILLGSMLIDAALLGILIFLFARHDASNELISRVVVVVGVTIGSLVIGLLWEEALGLWILAPQMLLSLALLIWVVGANLVQALSITVLFFGIKIGVRLALTYVLSPE